MHTLAQTEQTIQFDNALRQAAAQATTRYAGEHLRIGRGLVIALNGGVTRHQDGTTTVQSASDKEVMYCLRAGLCDCPDVSNAPDARCKHYFAAAIWRKAMRSLTDAQNPLRHAYHMASGEEGHTRLMSARRATFYPGGHHHGFVCQSDELCVGPAVQAQGRPF